LNPGPLGLESSVLTTRPWLLALKQILTNNGENKFK
jgi:hypothetical protein